MTRPVTASFNAVLLSTLKPFRFPEQEGNKVSQREFEMNLDEKMESAQFTGDMGFLIRTGIDYNISEAMKLVKEKIISII